MPVYFYYWELPKYKRLALCERHHTLNRCFYYAFYESNCANVNVLLLVLSVEY